MQNCWPLALTCLMRIWRHSRLCGILLGWGQTAASWLGVKEVRVRGMEKKGPETWGRDRGWEGEVMEVRVAQKIAGNHRDAHTTGSSLVRWQQRLPEVCWEGRISCMNEQPFSHGHLLRRRWLASGEGAGLRVRAVDGGAACTGPEMWGLVLLTLHICVLTGWGRAGQERVKLKIYWTLPPWFLDIFYLVIHFSPLWAVFVQC